MPKTNLPATGGAGIAPPPDAPIELSQPLQPDAGGIVVFDPRTQQPTGEVVDPLARAQANERTLAPLNFNKPATPASQSVVPGKEVAGLDPFYANLPKPAAPIEPDRSMPAASNSDSPSRGLPGTAPIPSVRKTTPMMITGGFGDSGEAQYFPLSGPELLVLVQKLMDTLNDRIQNDLRFSMAITYPRVKVKLQVLVEGEVDDQGFDITYVDAHETTPLEVAQQHAQSVVFVLTEQRREFTETGDVETPPDALRDELGLVKPHKQIVKSSVDHQGRSIHQFADLPVGF